MGTGTAGTGAARGASLATLHHELAGEGLVFADVAVRAQTVASFDETERWQALAAIQSRYFEAVDSRGVWDQQTARLWAIHHEACHTLRDVVLVGTVDLNATQKAMLDQVADRVTALIFAPETLAERTILVGCEQIQEAVQEHIRVDPSLAPRVSGAAALRLVLRTLEDQTIPPRFDQSAIELLGWLELPLDDAEAAIVTGFNEGYGSCLSWPIISWYVCGSNSKGTLRP